MKIPGFNSGGGTPPEDVAKLQEEIERLTKALAEQTDKTTDAERERDAAAKAAAEAQGNGGIILLQGDSREVPTGRKVKVAMCARYKADGYRDDGRQILKPVIEEQDVETYYYKVDLPPSGGYGLKINGVDMYHGETYELDLHLLRTVKDMVARSWGHEASIRGSDENVFRRPQNVTLRGGRSARA